MTTRESIFVCRFTSSHDHRTAHVRAWNEREAEELFREELTGDDVHEPGTIEVIGAGGRARLQAPFEPPAAGQ
jgi:hypothetical protein